jgi:hypothetical protein
MKIQMVFWFCFVIFTGNLREIDGELVWNPPTQSRNGRKSGSASV